MYILDVSMASPDRYPCYHAFSIDQALKGATPGVDFGQAGIGAEDFSYASTEENSEGRQVARGVSGGPVQSGIRTNTPQPK